VNKYFLSFLILLSIILTGCSNSTSTTIKSIEVDTTTLDESYFVDTLLIQPENNSPFTDAVSKIVSGNSYYVEYRVVTGESINDFQLFRNNSIQVYWYPELKTYYNADAVQVTANADYPVIFDIANHVMRYCIKGTFINNGFIQSVDGTLQSCKYTRNNIDYDALKCVSDNITYTFINGNNHLIGIDVSDNSNNHIYYDIVTIEITIPTESNLFDYSSCVLSDEMVYQVISDSMTPTLKSGEVYIIESVADNTSLKVGDIIAYKADLLGTGNKDTIVLHRIYKINYDNNGKVNSYITKGDENPIQNREVCLLNDIMGKLADKVEDDLNLLSAE
jgi:signal peptidase I